ncbi:hypothetical protein BH18ACT1_BH18ACT1_14560 [soil metagenome]
MSRRRWAALVGALAVGLVVAVVVVTLLAEDDGPEVLVSADFPAALVALPDGGLLYAERAGAVRSVGVDRDDPELVAEVDTDPADDDQRGLVGLARDEDGRVFATWTRADDGRIVVGQVAPGPERLIWEGPPSVVQANGGTLTFDPADPDHQLVVGIGDLTEPERTDDPTTPNGKLLVLDPDGRPDQEPEVLSTGWNNPFAYAVDENGEYWVADNAPPSKRERIARADLDGRPTSVTELDENLAPAGVVALGDSRYGVCTYLTRELRVFEVGGDGRAVEDEDARIEGCRLAVTALADGRLALATEDEITVVDAP